MKPNYFISFFLVVFLFATHSKLFYWLNPVFANGELINFDWTVQNAKTIESEVYGLLFGIITVHILNNRSNKGFYSLFVVIVALLDGVAVLWLYNDTIEDFWRVALTSSHYAIYTIFIILAWGFAFDTQRKKPAQLQQKGATQKSAKVDDLEKKVIELLQSDMSQSDIARELNIKPYKVTRIKQKNS